MAAQRIEKLARRFIRDRDAYSTPAAEVVWDMRHSAEDALRSAALAHPRELEAVVRRLQASERNAAMRDSLIMWLVGPATVIIALMIFAFAKMG